MSNALVPLQDIERMAASIAASGLFGVKTKEQAMGLMLLCQAEGLHPAIAARDYHIVQGRPALKADAMMARYMQSGGKVEWHDYNDSKVSATFSHPQGGSVKVEWTIEMAKRIGLAGKDVWKSYPRAMLRARVISEGVRTTNPGVAVGIYTPEEVGDFAEKDITPPSPTRGAMAALPIKTQEVVMETAAEVKALLSNDQAADAYALWQNSKFDADETVAFWSQLDSKQKGVLGRMGEAERAAAAGTISEPQKKRLEARIKELGLDRDEVKAHCVKTWGVAHFSELTKEQYSTLDASLESSKAAPQPSSVPPLSPASAAGAAPTQSDDCRACLQAVDAVRGQKGAQAVQQMIDQLENEAERKACQDALDWQVRQLKAKSQTRKDADARVSELESDKL